MKKMFIFMLVAVMMLSVANVASAAVSFTLNTPCEAIADTELYNHVSPQKIWKYSGGNLFYVKHRVEETDAQETNRIAAYSHGTGRTMGANWHRPDNREYQCMSNALVISQYYSVAGRGNTDYATDYGLDRISLYGSMRAD